MKALILDGGVEMKPIDPMVYQMLDRVLALNEQIIKALLVPAVIHVPYHLSQEAMADLKAKMEQA